MGLTMCSCVFRLCCLWCLLLLSECLVTQKQPPCDCSKASVVTPQGLFPLNSHLEELTNSQSWPGAPRDLKSNIHGNRYNLTWRAPDDGSAEFLQGFEVCVFSLPAYPYPDTCFVNIRDFKSVFPASMTSAIPRVQDVLFNLPCVFEGDRDSQTSVQVLSLPLPPDDREDTYHVDITFSNKDTKERPSKQFWDEYDILPTKSRHSSPDVLSFSAVGASETQHNGILVTMVVVVTFSASLLIMFVVMAIVVRRRSLQNRQDFV